MPNDLNDTTFLPAPDSSDAQLRARQLARSWGWLNPSAEVLALAEEALAVHALPVGEIVIRWEILPAADVKALLASRPEGVLTLEHFAAAASSNVAGHTDRILCMKDLRPFYANLAILPANERMADDAVHKRCEALDAVLCKTDAGREVLVFSRHEKMKTYGRLGRGDRANDPVWHEELLFAVGIRDDISALLKAHVQGTSAGKLQHGGTLLAADADTPEMRELSRLADHALSIGATDISIKPLDQNGLYKVRLRRWGKLVQPFRKPMVWDADLANRILQLLSVRSGANRFIDIQRLPTDGNLKYRSAAGMADLRLGFIPLNRRGDIKNLRSAAIRVFTKSEKRSVRFDDIGVPPEVRLHLTDALRGSRGSILVMGPVGSGKSTLCAAMIGEHYHMFGDTLERLSIENPVERELEGITQFELPSGVNNIDDKEAWHLILKAFKRHDLDLAFVGEMRDSHSADFCVAVGAMGQMALGTMHANDTIIGYDIVRTMVDADMRFQAAEAINLCVGVRLINAVCPHCCERGVRPDEDEQRRFRLALENLGEQHQLPEQVVRARPGGCEHCDEGYGDYVQIYEVLPFTRAVKDAALSMLAASDVRQHRGQMAAARKLTLMGSAMQLLRAGRVDIATVLSF